MTFRAALRKTIPAASNMDTFTVLMIMVVFSHMQLVIGQECSEKLDLALVIDGSGSICVSDPSFREGDRDCNNWRSIKRFVQELVDQFDISPDNVRVALVTFSDQANLQWTLSRYTNQNDLKDAIGQLQWPDGWTNTYDGLRMVRTMVFGNSGDRPGVKNKMIILTDGNPNRNTLSTEPEAQRLKDDDVDIISIGVTRAINEETLRYLCSPPHRFQQNYYIAADFLELPKVIDELKDNIRNCNPPPPPVCSDDIVDLALVVDRSGSICDNDPSFDRNSGTCNNWNDMKKFLLNVVENLTIRPDRSRVALVTFSDNGELQWDLNRYTNKNDLEDAINNLNYPGGWTNTYEGLNIMRNRVFSGSNGDRSNVRDLAIIVTDGIPTRNEGLVEPEAEEVHRQNIEVIAIGVTEVVDTRTLEYLSTSPHELNHNYFTSVDFQSLQLIVGDIQRRTCETPRPVQPTPSPACNAGVLDLVFLVDGSGSICDEDRSFNRQTMSCNNWEAMQNFLSSIINQLDIGPDHTRVAAIGFSNNGNLEWDLSEHQDKDSIQNAVRSLKYRGGWTNTYEGLNLMRTRVFGGANGDRLGVRNMAVIVTDGKPTRNEDKTEPEAEEAHKEGTGILVVGITSSIDEKTLQYLSSPPHQLRRNYFTSENFESLQRIVDEVKQQATVCGNPIGRRPRRSLRAILRDGR